MEYICSDNDYIFLTMQRNNNNTQLPCITIQQLRDSGLQYAFCFGDSMLVTDHIETIERFRRPCRIEAVTTLVCINGEAECVINLKQYHLCSNMIVVGFPDDIIQIVSSCRLEAYAVLMSPRLINELAVDNSRRSDFYLRIRQNAVCYLPQNLMQSLKPYYALLRNNIQTQTEETGEIIRGLLHAFAYSVIARIRAHQPQQESDTTATGRHSSQLFGEFMTLVKRHHTCHRGVKFYANKLCLTPNYLSGVVKEYTGKTATEWVNDFVILEAKIMLKDTGYSIQEISDRLHFPDQSTFGKYFKKLTGVSPKMYKEK